jgi:hypothetical protein
MNLMPPINVLFILLKREHRFEITFFYFEFSSWTREFDNSLHVPGQGQGVGYLPHPQVLFIGLHKLARDLV